MNGSLTPFDVTLRSEKKTWWVCKRVHEWEARVDHRSRGSGCPYCKGELQELVVDRLWPKAAWAHCTLCGIRRTSSERHGLRWEKSRQQGR